MSSSIVGPATWSLGRNREGHRAYKLTNKVKVSDVGGLNTLGDGPFIVLNTPGLPLVGSIWAYGNDLDVTAYCTSETIVKPHPAHKDEKVRYWMVENTFSTIPNRRCQDEQFEDPLLEPQHIGGNFLRSSQEAFTDNNGVLIKSSSHEFFRGSEVDFDVMMPAVHIDQNVADLELGLVTSLISPRPSLNSSSMWGLAARTIKFSGFSWEQVFYGTCDFYYTRSFDFEVNYGTWDRTLVDKGTKVLFGEYADTDDCTDSSWLVKTLPCGGTPDADNPDHFIRFKDRQGENSDTILNGGGLPYNPAASGTGSPNVSTPGEVDFNYYPGGDLFSLGVPTVLGPPS